MNPNSTSVDGLYGRESASEVAKASVEVPRESGPQTGAEALHGMDAALHARRAHPDWEYATTEGPRKRWADINTPPTDGHGEPDHTWQRNTDAGRDGWERFDHTEESYWRRPKQAVQTSTEEQPDPDPQAVILDAISTTLNAAGYWLPLDGKRAVAETLLKLRNDEAEQWRRQAVTRGLELSRLQRTLELVDATARAWLADRNSAECAHAVLDALTAYPAKETS